MLVELYIKDLVLIHDLSLEFGAGFSAFTGETGAGKSILLDALALTLGKRGDSSLIRKGALQATVTATFNIPENHDVYKSLEDLGLLNLDDVTSLQMRRLLNDKGSKAFINDIPVNLNTLKQVGDNLLEIHGQFDHLFDVKSHQKNLDHYITEDSFSKTLNEIKDIFSIKKELEKNIKQLTEEESHYQFNLTLQKTIVEELSPLNLLPNEEETLLNERKEIETLGKTSSILEKCHRLFDDHTFSKELGSSITQLERIDSPLITSILDPLKRMESDLLEAKEQIDDLFNATKDAMHRLQDIDERLHLLRSKAKKFNVSTDDLVELLENSKAFMNKDFEALRFDLTKKLENTIKNYREKADILSSYRKKYALKLEDDINNELSFLKLPNAKFKVSITSLDIDNASPKGLDSVEFLISANKQQDFTNLSKSASGGELARIMLALKTILSQKSDLFSIVFDEIETGVSGAVASAIGERMKALSQKIQVLAITHSPQIAAQADAHYFVHKVDHKDHTKTQVDILKNDQRTLEIARMLSGETLTDGAMSAAKDLLKY